MKIILSPAKSLDFESQQVLGAQTQPLLGQQAQNVMTKLAKKSAKSLQKLQSISDNLATLNFERNQQWRFPAEGPSRQAILAFTGDVYQGLQANEFTEEDIDFAAQHLYILSGAYGILRPTDLIMPYRLEMGTKLTVGRAKNLYQYWAKPLGQYLKENLLADEFILNLASKEYFKAWKTSGIKNPVINVDFKDKSRGKYKIISFFAKKARGTMAKFVIQHRINSPNQLKEFNLGGYYYHPQESTENHLVFLRDEVAR
jgi:cytoplasmic iron level regulating protein YaaA (DUF328/UPF0246 family)